MVVVVVVVIKTHLAAVSAATVVCRLIHAVMVMLMRLRQEESNGVINGGGVAAAGLVLDAEDGLWVRHTLAVPRRRKHHRQVVIHFTRELRVLEMLLQRFQSLRIFNKNK